MKAKKHGEGILFYKNGNIKYEGTFKKDEYDGKGKLFYENGNYYIGTFKDGDRNGNGELYNKNGDIIYMDDFEKDEFNGFGIYYYPNRNYYIGGWKEGKRNGEGSLYYKNDKVKYIGKFKNDICEKENDDFDEEGNDKELLEKVKNTVGNAFGFFEEVAFSIKETIEEKINDI